MRAAVKVCCLLLVARWCLPEAVQAQAPAAQPEAASEAASVSLPLRRVIMFTSGVAYFERFGHVQDDATVELHFRTEQINDLLKSMVVQDLAGGHVAGVDYQSREPVEHALKKFPIDLSENPTLAKLLAQVRGHRVEVHVPNAVQGVIVSLEQRRRKLEDGTVLTEDVLNLLTDQGLRSVVLQQAGRIRLLDPQLDAELRKALGVLAGGTDTRRKTVRIRFQGQGRRPVRVGYVQEMPVWKTSYRLVLQDEKKALLQGWAIVENVTEEDWNQVELVLVSGRPVSFRMDLYQPLFVPRPEVRPQLYTQLVPRKYEADLLAEDREARSQASSAPQAMLLREEKARRALRKNAPGEFGGAGGGLGFAGGTAGRFDAKGKAPWSIALAAQLLARGEEAGELFQYRIATPVTLARQRSAMLPIVQSELGVERVSIYGSGHPKHPMLGLRFANTSGAFLMQGPITVFEQASYAGDAQLGDTPQGASRLVSYALDLKVEVALRDPKTVQHLVAAGLSKGVLHLTHSQRRTRSYEIKNSDTKPRHVLVEYPIDPAWKLVEPKEVEEKTRSVYRLGVQVAAGKTATLKVTEERTVSQQVVINTLDEPNIRIFLQTKELDPRIKKVLQEVVRRKRRIEQLVQQRRVAEGQIRAIAQDQERIRRNMSALDRTTDLYKRYVEKFTRQEAQIESLREQIQKLQQQEAQARRELDDYLLKVDIKP